MASFSAQLDAWTLKAKGRTTAVFKAASQKVGTEANTPKGLGGRLPLDTGFLRGSFAASLEGMPVGPTRPSEGKPSAEDVGLTIARAQLGDTIYMGWTAVYARVQEVRNGFLESAAQNWPKIVREAAAEAKRRFP